MLKTKSERTKLLQTQFICPIWAVWSGAECNVYFSRWTARQAIAMLEAKRASYVAYDGHGEDFREASAWAGLATQAEARI